MATLKIYFDKRSRDNDGKFPVKLILRHKGVRTPIPLGLRFSEKEWEEIDSRIKSGTESRHTPSRLVSQYKAQAESALVDVKLENDLEKMSVLQIKKKMYEKYRGENHLLSPMDRYADHRDYLGRMNKALHKLGMHHRNGCRYEGTPLFPRLSTYYSRHSWATLAARLDVPIDTISRALGHSIGSDVTNIYIDFDYRKIDKANRKVLDALKEG